MRAIGRRLAFFVVTVWAAVTLNFLLPRLMPGNPAEALLAQYPHITPQAFRALTTLLGGGQHQSLIVQYGEYWKRVVTLNFGISITTSFGTPVKTMVMNALPWTLGLVGRDDDPRLRARHLHRARERVASRHVARQCAAADGRHRLRSPVLLGRSAAGLHL